MKNKTIELTIYEREEIRIGDDIYITVIDSKVGRVKIGIEAPDDLKIRREEKNE